MNFYIMTKHENWVEHCFWNGEKMGWFSYTEDSTAYSTPEAAKQALDHEVPGRFTPQRYWIVAL